MSSYKHTYEGDMENIIVGVIIISNGILGTAVNFGVMLMIVRTTSFHNAFGYICFSHFMAASAALFMGVIWTGPVTILSFNEFITATFLGSRFGQLMHLFWFVTMFCHLQIAVNRLIAVAWPFAYNKLRQRLTTEKRKKDETGERQCKPEAYSLVRNVVTDRYQNHPYQKVRGRVDLAQRYGGEWAVHRQKHGIFCYFCLVFIILTGISAILVYVNSSTAYCVLTIYLVRIDGFDIVERCHTSMLVRLMPILVDCWVWYDIETLSWINRDTACFSIAHQVYIYGTMITCLSIISVNTCTFYFIRKQMKALRQSGGSIKKQRMVQMKRNISLYIQGCVSAVLVIVASFLSSLIPPLVSNRLQLAIVNCLNWELILASHGVILVIFNKPFRNVFRSRVILGKTTTNNE